MPPDPFLETSFTPSDLARRPGAHSSRAAPVAASSSRSSRSQEEAQLAADLREAMRLSQELDEEERILQAAIRESLRG